MVKLSWIILISVHFSYICCLKIVSFVGPKLVERLSVPLLVFDCPYILHQEDEQKELVVKWFYNDVPFPIYQWIPGNAPQDLIFFKGRIDLSFKASANPLTMYRSLAIKNPDTEMTGNYTCSVSTFNTEDSKSHSILVYAPADSVRLKFHRVTRHEAMLRCHVKDIYPKPQIRLYRGLRHPETALNGLTTFVESQGQHPCYDVVYEYPINRLDIQGEEVFICVVSLPGTNYFAQAELIFSADQFDISGTSKTWVPLHLLVWLLLVALRITPNGL